MSIIRDLKNSRLAKFLLVHIIVCVAVTVFLISKNPNIHAPFFPPYFTAFIQTFADSFAGAFLSLAQLTEGAFNNFAGAGTMTLFSRSVPLPVVSGVLSLMAFLLTYIGVSTYGKKTMYFIFMLASLCFILGAWTYYLDAANNTKAVFGHFMLLQPAR